MRKSLVTDGCLAQKLILQLHKSSPDHPMFDQVGLLNGEKTVIDFPAVGELGCALQHALYMAHEADIPSPNETVRALP